MTKSGACDNYAQYQGHLENNLKGKEMWIIVAFLFFLVGSGAGGVAHVTAREGYPHHALAVLWATWEATYGRAARWLERNLGDFRVCPDPKRKRRLASSAQDMVMVRNASGERELQEVGLSDEEDEDGGEGEGGETEGQSTVARGQ